MFLGTIGFFIESCCLMFSEWEYNLMFFWPCIMNWLYINYQLWCTDYYLFIKYYSPLHVSRLKCSSSGGYSCTHAAYGNVTLYESSWWPVGTQFEWELTGGGRLLVGVLRQVCTQWWYKSQAARSDLAAVKTHVTKMKIVISNIWNI